MARLLKKIEHVLEAYDMFESDFCNIFVSVQVMCAPRPISRDNSLDPIKFESKS